MAVVDMKTLIEAYNPTKHDNDIEWLSHNLRDMDLLELREKGKWDGYNQLQDAFSQPGYQNYCVYLESGEMLGVFGISEQPLYMDMHCIWFMGSTTLEHNFAAKRAFIQGSKQILQQWVKEYGRLFNYAHRANKLIVGWLQSVGAAFYDTEDKDYKLFIID